jgi:outer membrane protein TolC
MQTLVVFLTAAGAGCTHYQAAPLEPQRSAQQFASRELDAPRLRDAITRLMPEAPAEWPPREWDRADLLAVALVQNPTLAVANAQTHVALAHEITAGELPNPNLTLQSEYARHDPYPWLYGVALNWLVRSPERRRLETTIAQLDTHNARLELMDEAWKVRRELTAALTDWESARRRSQVLDRLAVAQQRFVELEQQRITAGEDAPGELIGSQHALIEIEQQQADVRAALLTAQAAAANALGTPVQALDAIVVAWPNWGEPPTVAEAQLRDMREQALLSRSDLGMAIDDYSAAEAKLHLAIARQYPQYELNPGFYWDHGIAKFPFDVSFALPFNGNKGEIAEARAGRDLAGQRMLALQAAIYGEVAAAERAEQVARASMTSAERQLQAARRQQQQVDLGLRLGAADSLEQIGAQIIAMRVELEVIQMRAQLQISRNVLEDALHAPLSGPELKLSISTATLAAGAGA